MYNFSLENEKNLTKENLLKEVNSYNIFSYYIKDIKINRAMLSPLRDERNPSFGIFVKDKEFFFKDFTLKQQGDCVKFVQLLFRLNFNEALIKIANDLGVSNKFKIKKELKINKKRVKFNTNVEKLIENFKNEIKIKKRKWFKHDFNFWNQFGITKSTLEKYNVYPISHIFVNDKIIKAEKYAYCFIENKDNKQTITIYQPYSKDRKWVKTHDQSIWYGWTQLPKKGEKLIITKSKKDIMSIVDNSIYPSTSMQNEKVLPKFSVVKELFSRFTEIYLLYDNDYDKDINWGRIAGKELADKFGFIQIEIPSEYKCKDFSELIKKLGKEKSNKILENLINNAILF